MPQDTATILADPNFHALPPQERIRVLNTVDPNFMGLPEAEKMKVVSALGSPQTPELTSTQTAALKREKIPVNASPTFMEAQKQVLASKMEQAQPQSTIGTRTREAAIGTLEPFTLGNLMGAIQQGGQAALQMLTGGGTSKAQEMVEGAIRAPLQPLVNVYEGIKTGDYDRAAYGAGGVLSQTVPAVEGGVNAVKKVLPIVTLRNQARNIAQNLTSTSAFKTTEPMVEKFNTAAADTAARQAASDTVIADRNRQAAASAADRTADRQAAVEERNRTAEHNADIRTQDQVASVEEKNRVAAESAAQKNTENAAAFDQKNAAATAEYKQTAEETMKANREALVAASRDAAVHRSIEEGSKVLGERVKDLDTKLRGEANVKYQEVTKATNRVDPATGQLADPGVPLSQLSDAVTHAENNILKGSPESIKQFRDISSQAAEADESATLHADGAAASPDSGIFKRLMETAKRQGPESDLYKQLAGDGLMDEPSTVSFEQLRGYSSELGTKLAQGNLPGDVYQAMKYLKEKIDAAKAVVAERNGVGPQLKSADAFWRSYQELLYDPESSLTKVRKAVGVKNPGEMAAEFFRNKGHEIAVGRLKQLRTTYGSEANGVADLAQNLNAAREESAAYRATTQKNLPKAPKPGQAPATIAPKELPIPGRTYAELNPIPEPIEPEVIPNKVLKGPEPPTAEEIVAEKRQRVEAKGRNLAEISKYDAGTLAAAPLGILLGHPFLGLAPLAAKYGLSYILTRPGIIEWIARPTFSDLAAIEKMPIAEQGALRSQLQGILDQESAGGRAVQPAGAIQNFLNKTAIVSRAVAIPSNSSAGVKNRREALEALGQQVP